MSWFQDKFLPSIFERAGLERKWLTQKQTAVCTRSMEKRVVSVQQPYGEYTRHTYYITTWQGRHVQLDYSKLNGCGVIQFGMNEQERMDAEAQRERWQREREHDRLVRWLRHRPETFMEELNKLRTNLDVFSKYIEEDIAEQDAEALEYDRSIHARYQKQVAEMEAVLTAG